MIEIRSLSYKYPSDEKPALSNVNLKVDDGEFVVLTGVSGCGKTTLCRCLNGLVPHFYGGVISGEVVVEKLKVSNHSTAELSRYVGSVFQNPESQLFSSTAERDVAFALECLALPSTEIWERVDWSLKALDISNLRHRRPSELSGGQQQKIVLASVLAMKPKILVLDEPTSFIDPASSKSIVDLIWKISKERNITVFMVEHRLELVAKYADRLIVMDDGKISHDGNPREVFSMPEASLSGIDMPKITRLHRMLIANGLMSPAIALSPEEFTVLLRSRPHV